MLYSWTAMLAPPEGPRVCPATSRGPGKRPVRASAYYIDIGSVDSCRDDILMYAMRLSQAGVNVDLHLWVVPHGYQLFSRRQRSPWPRCCFDDFIAVALGSAGVRFSKRYRTTISGSSCTR